MVLWQKPKKRKASGGLTRKLRDKRKCEMGRTPAMTKNSSKEKVNEIRTRGSNKKLRALALHHINVFDAKKGAHQVATIKKVIESSASRHFVRMGVITKGTILETSVGKVKVTNRPGQEGHLNGILLE